MCWTNCDKLMNDYEEKKEKLKKKIEIMETWTDDVMTKREKINEDKLKQNELDPQFHLRWAVSDERRSLPFFLQKKRKFD